MGHSSARTALIALFLVLTLCPGAEAAAGSAAPDTSHIRSLRLAAVIAIPVSATAASYVYANNVWWTPRRRPFHLHDGNDLEYALNLDKVGHFYAGAFFSDLSTRGLLWAGMDEERSELLGALFGMGVQLGFEIKDGFAADWGFSCLDVTAGFLGSLYAMGRRRSPLLAASRVKMGYAFRSSSYWSRAGEHAFIVDDYVNQTYWLSLDVGTLLPRRVRPLWPPFLRLAAGVGIDPGVDGQGGGRREFFLGLDYSLRDLLGLLGLKDREPGGMAGLLLFVADYLKLPAPAIRLAPTFVAYGLYW